MIYNYLFVFKFILHVFIVNCIEHNFLFYFIDNIGTCFKLYILYLKTNSNPRARSKTLDYEYLGSIVNIIYHTIN